MNDGTGMPQTAVVIGGTSDIGRSILRALVARRLDRIILAGRDADGLAAVADELLGPRRQLGGDGRLRRHRPGRPRRAGRRRCRPAGPDRPGPGHRRPPR